MKKWLLWQLSLSLYMLVALAVPVAACALETPQFTICGPNGAPCGTTQTTMTVTDNTDNRSVVVNQIPADAVGTIMWQPSEDAAYYRYAIRNINTNSVDVPDTSTSDTRVWITNLQIGVVYKLAVGAISADDNQIWNDVFFVIESMPAQNIPPATLPDYAQSQSTYTQLNQDEDIYSGYSQKIEAPDFTPNNPLPVSMQQAAVYGEFYSRSMTLTIGEAQQVEGIAFVENGALERVTLTIPGFFGSDENNRYATVQTGSASLMLGAYREFIVDTQREPFNAPGQYTLCLNVKATDGIWAVVDEIPVTILPTENMGSNISSEAAHSDFISSYDQPPFDVESSDGLLSSHTYDNESNAFNENILIPVITFPQNGSSLGNTQEITVQWKMPDSDGYETEAYTYYWSRVSVELTSKDGELIGFANDLDISFDQATRQASYRIDGLQPDQEYVVNVGIRWIKEDTEWYTTLNLDDTVTFSTANQNTVYPERGMADVALNVPAPRVTLQSPQEDSVYAVGDTLWIIGHAEYFHHGMVRIENLSTGEEIWTPMPGEEFSLDYQIPAEGRYRITVMISDSEIENDPNARRAEQSVIVNAQAANRTATHSQRDFEESSIITSAPHVTLQSPQKDDAYAVGDTLWITGQAEFFHHGMVRIENLVTGEEIWTPVPGGEFSLDYQVPAEGRYRITVMISDSEIENDPNANRDEKSVEVRVGAAIEKLAEDNYQVQITWPAATLYVDDSLDVHVAHSKEIKAVTVQIKKDGQLVQTRNTVQLENTALLWTRIYDHLTEDMTGSYTITAFGYTSNDTSKTWVCQDEITVNVNVLSAKVECIEVRVDGKLFTQYYIGNKGSTSYQLSVITNRAASSVAISVNGTYLTEVLNYTETANFTRTFQYTVVPQNEGIYRYSAVAKGASGTSSQVTTIPIYAATEYPAADKTTMYPRDENVKLGIPSGDVLSDTVIPPAVTVMGTYGGSEYYWMKTATGTEGFVLQRGIIDKRTMLNDELPPDSNPKPTKSDPTPNQNPPSETSFDKNSIKYVYIINDSTAVDLKVMNAGHNFLALEDSNENGVVFSYGPVETSSDYPARMWSGSFTSDFKTVLNSGLFILAEERVEYTVEYLYNPPGPKYVYGNTSYKTGKMAEQSFDRWIKLEITKWDGLEIYSAAESYLLSHPHYGVFTPGRKVGQCDNMTSQILSAGGLGYFVWNTPNISFYELLVGKPMQGYVTSWP